MGQAGEVIARDWETGKAIRLQWEGGRIARLETVPALAETEWWVAPALVDLQVNGYAGVDFQRDALFLEDLLAATRRLQAAGCAHYLLTLVTDEWRRMMERLRHLRALRTQSPELRDAILGWHIEGPFLSAEPGFHGTHNPAWMQNPTAAHIRELRETTGDDPVLLTLAPERNGSLAAIELAVALGMKVSLGHTDAPAALLREAVHAGATGFTHLGNGCPARLDRHDNILWRVLETPGLIVSLIPDQIHVSPALFRLVHRLLSSESIFYVTDAMAAAGAPAGRYTLGALEIEVGPRQVVQLPGSTNYAGSALRPIDGVFRAVQMLNCPWQAAWRHFSLLPAAFMVRRMVLAPGEPANFCLLRTTSEQQLQELQVYIHGTPVDRGSR
ncbi:MAG: N-acetylglucosamine-6-phosphate deacetylase [Candidatus Omnitrophica bacterium]|nr:N-acetylglucosamine-6-phosphate deacetylase [Candidatus Omnitrophota bacterium]